MNSTIEEINEWVKNQVSYKEIFIKGIWGIKCNFQPSIFERKFKYNILVAQTLGQGACYYEGKEITQSELSKLLGTNYEFKTLENDYLNIAILDSIAASLNIKPYKKYTLQGKNDKKAIIRSEILVNEVIAISEQIKKKNISVCNIGVVSLVIEKLLKANFSVSACDKDKTIIGKNLFNKVEVLCYKQTLNQIKNSDIALVTGMVLATNSIEEIISVAKKNNTKLILFAETGAGFAPFYIEQKSIDVVISEPFPFYTFNGVTQINIFRK